MRIFFVAPDYHEDRPRSCVNGWGSMFLTVAPDGTALPCHTARMLPGLDVSRTCASTALRDIWFDSEGFNRYRGTGWMKEPCSTLRAPGGGPRRLPLPGLACWRTTPPPPTRCAA